jgi:sec-independent protein translocase protein TatA
MARSLGKSARILKSEAKAMKEDGKASAPADPPNPGDDQASAQRVIQAAPGDVTSSRPVNEPTDTTKR